MTTFTTRDTPVLDPFERAGSGDGSFHRFFASKEELTLEALDHAWDIVRSTVVEPTLGADVDHETWARRIREVIGT